MASKAQTKASRAWEKKNPERARYMRYKSTSPTPLSSFGSYTLKIKVPSGIGRGAYLEELTSSPQEYEFLLARETKFKITNVINKKAQSLIEMEVIP